MRESVLLTGFEPFSGMPINASWEAARQLEGEVIAQHPVSTLCLPVVHHQCFALVREKMLQLQPKLVVLGGMDQRRSTVTVERIAMNVIESPVKDNAGNAPVSTPVVPDGPDGLFGTASIRAMVKAIRGAGIPAQISNDCGVFVSNSLFYEVLHYVRYRGLETRVAFVHIPVLPELIVHRDRPSMALSLSVQALRTAIDAALKHYDKDLTGEPL